VAVDHGFDWELLVRLLAACLLGAAVGIEREARGQDAGLRTHAVVALGAALFTIAGAYGFEDFADGGVTDPTRVAAQVASGIGFIGAGAIIKDRGGTRGLTTAATLWLAASLGMAAGAGLYLTAAASVVIVLAVLVGLRWMRFWVRARLGPLLDRLDREVPARADDR
jgi:putative Mg2+ transporter-C (MgtC) family protein